jgi:hypothetical protein
MSVDVRPAMPETLPHMVGFRAGRERVVRWVATTVTVVTSLICVLVVATAAVMLGLT